ncbi:hypothetical protein DFS34DRAFT_646939 [Phlyctochytrium arcticum]|nr:hypothetical protein DFS34DRAFT_646939 [Phlyctochytrium arcticum]
MPSCKNIIFEIPLAIMRSNNYNSRGGVPKAPASKVFKWNVLAKDFVQSSQEKPQAANAAAAAEQFAFNPNAEEFVPSGVYIADYPAPCFIPWPIMSNPSTLSHIRSIEMQSLPAIPRIGALSATH